MSPLNYLRHVQYREVVWKVGTDENIFYVMEVNSIMFDVYIYIYIYIYMLIEPGSSVGIATAYCLGGPGIESR